MAASLPPPEPEPEPEQPEEVEMIFLRDSFGFKHAGTRVTKVYELTEAHQKGVKVGWRILTINYENVPNDHTIVLKKIQEAKDWGPTHIRFLTMPTTSDGTVVTTTSMTATSNSSSSTQNFFQAKRVLMCQCGKESCMLKNKYLVVLSPEPETEESIVARARDKARNIYTQCVEDLVTDDDVNYRSIGVNQAVIAILVATPTPDGFTNAYLRGTLAVEQYGLNFDTERSSGFESFADVILSEQKDDDGPNTIDPSELFSEQGFFKPFDYDDSRLYDIYHKILETWKNEQRPLYRAMSGYDILVGDDAIPVFFVQAEYDNGDAWVVERIMVEKEALVDIVGSKIADEYRESQR